MRPRACAVVDCVAVAFVLVLVVEGFGVGEANLCAFAAGDGELGVGGGEGFAVEQQVDMALGRHRYRRIWEGFQVGGIGSDDFARRRR